MSSSMIEVVSGSDMQVEIMGSEEDDNEKESPEIHTLSASDSFSHVDSQDNIEEIEHSFQTASDFQLSNESIFFSPQDMNSEGTVKKKNSGGKRGRPLGSRNKFDSLTINIDEFADYGNINLPVACEVCGKVTANGKALVDHMASHDDIKQYFCSECPKVFTRDFHLQAHMSVHGTQNKFQCPICHQSFSRHDCVTIHMRIHDKSKCFICEVCQKAFLTRGSLTMHARIHRGEKPFKCHICGKCFTQKFHVITHIRRHANVEAAPVTKKLGPKMFQCESCPRSFIRLSDFEKHVQWNHGVSPDTSVFLKARKLALNTAQGTGTDAVGVQLFSKSLEDKSKKKFVRRIMCTTGTQTDMEGGHEIIPRKYQNVDSVSSSTQLHAPSTPRVQEDDMYDEMFDEGMDRNFSSDEDEMDCEDTDKVTSTYQESNTITAITQVGRFSSTNDEAFDAVIGKVKSEIVKKDSILVANDNAEDMQNSPPEQQRTIFEPKPQVRSLTSNEDNDKIEIPNLHKGSEQKNEKVETQSLFKSTEPKAAKVLTDAQILSLQGSNINKHFNTRNWKCVGRARRRRGEGRGRVKPKNIIGITGATHLSLVRRSMINFISDKSTDSQPQKPNENVADSTADDVDRQDDEQSTDTETTSEIKLKRQSKSKQHGKDFVCDVKSCEICNPVEGKVKVVPEQQQNTEAKNETQSDEKNISQNLSKTKDQTQKLLQFLLSGDKNNLHGTNFKIIANDGKESSIENTKRNKDFDVTKIGQVAENEADTTEYHQFSIPTYSCKLCGREFRFEGKLHRHIESVHQNKTLFAPDVKPGRGALIRSDFDTFNKLHTGYRIIVKEEKAPIVKKKIQRNPEIEALRSEWDDDDDREDEEDFEEEPNIVVHSRPKMNIVPEVVPTPGDNVCVSTVQLHMNKITRPANPKNVNAAHFLNSKVGETIQLKNKCQDLLKKLFNNDLLMTCGFTNDHISNVLGKLLQHYGVKMIEDYGQGSHEVLKYNLWRLIEWKVTMEQMEEFYSEGKSVEEMMDDVMLGKVPILSHREPGEQSEQVEQDSSNNTQPTIEDGAEMSENQLMLSQVANVLSGQLNLGDGITQVVLAQDVSPEMLRGAHIVTIDPNTGQVISQVTADQVILADSLEQQIHSLEGSAVSTSASLLASLPPGSIVAAAEDRQGEKASTQNENQQLASPVVIKAENLPN